VEITRNSLETWKLPESGVTGSAYADMLATPTHGSRVSASRVHFAPGARTAWHSHPKGQTLWIIEGIGLVQRRGGPIEVVGPGDRVFFEPGEDHWHGAAPHRFMSHIAINEVGDDGKSATVGNHVTDDEYSTVPEITMSAPSLGYEVTRA
jgi:quercetin dioxygenase-like cupin family protein